MLAIPFVVAALGIWTGCDDGAGTDSTITPVEMPFADKFQLEQVITPEQSMESPIVRISGVSWNGDRFAIADVSEANAKLFSIDGSLLATVGRSGEGPGEFTAARYPALADGRLFVADGALGRVSVWTESGELERDIQIGAGFISDFALLPDGRLVFTGIGFGTPGAAMGVFADDGTALAQGLFTTTVLPADADPEAPWANMRQTMFAVANDTAWAVSTISDSLWAIPLAADTLRAESRRLAISGYVAPAAPAAPLRSLQDLSAWGSSFHGAAPPVASSELLVFPFVQGVLNNGDPTILVVRDGEGDWYALNDPPPVIAAFADRLLVIHNPLEDPVELAVYAKRSARVSR
ncbi:MAG: hypothetical protein F4Z31_06625 [Gemmatimonadetes bacterium]|nr:hypothetical protein [Gemmatimonadota bacterium]MYA41410.1 hypothetical protein [Gemmatimonadota bacterium]MYJ11116.1 hypothetical protein [Gemmatimonadota bacterium]